MDSLRSVADPGTLRCCMCHETKPIEDFAFRNKATAKRQGHCRKCHAAYRRQHYLANKAEYITREVARMNGYRIENRVRIREYLQQHPCIDCGETDLVVLEFDHRDRGLKTAVVGTLAARKPWPRVVAEITLCDVRCVHCHRRRTAKQMNWTKARPLELTVTALMATATTGIAETGNAENVLRQQCHGCGIAKPLLDFAYRNIAKGTRKRRCRRCTAVYSRRHYERNRRAYKRGARTGRKRDRREYRQRVLEYLLAHPCVDCGESDPLVLDFDHRNRVSKVKTVGELLRASTWRRIQAEIAKCDVRCAKCHRRRTARQFGWSKLATA